VKEKLSRAKKSCGVKVKVKVFTVHAMKAYRVSRGITPHILNPGIRWR
jgi:hypothetical protein